MRIVKWAILYDILVDTGDELVLDDGAILFPILSVLLGTPGRRH